MKCTLRKEILNNKSKNDQERKTYNQVEKQNTQTTSLTLITNEIHAKIFTCMMHVHLADIADPGTYEKELKEMLTPNRLPNIKAPKNPLSAKIFTKMAETEEDKMEDQGEKEEETEIEEESEKYKTKQRK